MLLDVNRNVQETLHSPRRNLKYRQVNLVLQILHSYFLIIHYIQVWTEHFELIGKGFPVPGDYEHLPFSLTYGDDVGKAVVSVINKRFVWGTPTLPNKDCLRLLSKSE